MIAIERETPTAEQTDTRPQANADDQERQPVGDLWLEDDILLEEVLVEDVSIDGMCGVY